MGCGTSTIKEERPKNINNQTNFLEKGKDKTSQANQKKEYQAKSNLNCSIPPKHKGEVNFYYFKIEIIEKNTIQIVCKSIVTHNKTDSIEDNKKKILFEDFNLIGFNDEFICKLEKTQLEYCIFTLFFKSGKKKILNFFDLIEYNFISESTSSDYIFSIWIIDFDDIDFDPECLYPTIKEYNDINNVVVECEYLGKGYSNQGNKGKSEGNLSTEVNNSIEENKLKLKKSELKIIEIANEISNEMLPMIKSNLSSNLANGIAVTKNKFQDVDMFFSLLKICNDESESFYSFTFTDNLSLKNNIFHLFESIGNMKNLLYLNLSMSYIYDKFLVKLMKSLDNKPLIFLDLSSNFITYYGASILSKWLRNNNSKSLKELYLQQNTMNEFRREGFNHIAESLCIHKSIQVLDVSFMNLTGFGGYMAKVIKTCPSLEILKIKFIKMNFDDYRYIIPALSKSQTLKELYMSDNDPKKEGHTDLLGKLVSLNSSIEILYLDNNGLALENSLPFFNGMKQNKTIKELSLNNYQEISAKKYIGMLKVCNNIKVLSILTQLKRSKEEILYIENYLKENAGQVKIKY